MIRVVLPAHLRTLARLNTEEIQLHVPFPATLDSVLDCLEASYPMLCGTIRDQSTHKRRAFVRFFACENDWSHEPTSIALPEAIANGREPLLIIGAIAGG